MVTAPAEAPAPPHAVRGHALRGGAPGRAVVARRADAHESLMAPMAPMALVQRRGRILQPHKERWPWSLTPREDARVPAPHEAPKTDSSPTLRRLSERTEVLWRNNQQLQRRLAALQAETYAAKLALAKRAQAAQAAQASPSSMGVLSPPSSPDSTTSCSSPRPCPRPCSPPPCSLPSSPASSCWSSPPSSPAASEGDVAWRFGLPYSPSSPGGPGGPDSPDSGA